ncbi:MAG: flavodoxin family protein [Nitrospinae bacterium]|nr:flavodoxin family protein [Nitrospinota bacterium]
MSESKKIVAIVATYRKGRIIDQAVDAILESAQEKGAEVEKIYLTDKDIKFCTNCRHCTQEAEKSRGECVLSDEMNSILDKIESSNALVLASPVNFGSSTAIYKRFMERLLPYTYWPWGTMIPKIRVKKRGLKVVVVTASAAPGIFTRLLTHIGRQFKDTANVLGGKIVGSLFIGIAAMEERGNLRDRDRQKAIQIGINL